MFSLPLFWLCAQLAAADVAVAVPDVDVPENNNVVAQHVAYPAVPHYRADLGVDLGADTYLFHHGETAFELELSPRIGLIVHPNLDVGFYAAVGYGGPIPAWSQMTMFGVGPYANLRVRLQPKLWLTPWLGVMYHYAFIEGFTGAAFGGDVMQFPQQSVRVDLHGDVTFGMSEHTALSFGPFVKARLAPISEGPGTAAQLSYGLRFSALSSF